MTKYLYGASVNGIQSYIFKTNKLKDIAGASEIVENLCTALFSEQIGISEEDFLKDKNIYQYAAGTIKCLFETKEKCQTFAKNFHLAIRKNAPGISLSEAVIKIKGDYPIGEEFSELERRLLISRNQINSGSLVSPMILRKNRETGQAIWADSKEFHDEDTELKVRATNGYIRLYDKIFENYKNKKNKSFASLKSEDHSWIAVLHADGNGLGMFIRSLNESIDIGFSEVMKEFSYRLNIATERAVSAAAKRAEVQEEDMIPVLIGGDDVSLILRANKAYEFTKFLLEEFENKTKEEFASILKLFSGDAVKIKKGATVEDIKRTLEKGLTICAGISYIKYKYPVHYGLHLADELCKESKKASKSISTELPPSSLMFHKVESSYISTFKDIIENQLTSSLYPSNPFKGGPYFLEEETAKKYAFNSITSLDHDLRSLERSDASTSKLRQWLGELFENKDTADHILERMKVINYDFINTLDSYHKMKNIDGTKEAKTAAFAGVTRDLMALKSF